MEIQLGDYCRCSSKEERNELLITLYSCGVHTIQRTIDEMDLEGDYETYPTVCFLNSGGENFITVTKNEYNSELLNEYSVRKFMERCHVKHKSQGKSRLEFVFR